MEGDDDDERMGSASVGSAEASGTAEAPKIVVVSAPDSAPASACAEHAASTGDANAAGASGRLLVDPASPASYEPTPPGAILGTDAGSGVPGGGAVLLDIEPARRASPASTDVGVSSTFVNAGDIGEPIPPPLPPPEQPPDAEADGNPVVLALQRCWDRLPVIPELPEAPRCPSFSFDMVGLLHQAPVKYCEVLWNYPIPLFAAYWIVLALLIIPLWRPISINTDLDTFNQVDSRTAANFTVYRDALKHMRAVKNQSSLSDRATFQLEILYQAKANALADNVDDFGEGSVFDEAALRDIRSFEHELRNLGAWKDLCAASDERARFRCEPGESLGNYMWPDRKEDDLDRTGYFKLDFDGRAREQLPVQATLTYITEDAALPHDPMKFLPQAFTGPRVRSSLLRSLFTFTAPKLDDTEFKERYEAFIADDLYPMLLEAAERAKKVVDTDTWEEPSHVLIYYRGDLLDGHEVRIILASDMHYAVGSLIITWIFLWLQLRSLFLAMVGISVITMSALLTYGILQVETLSLVSFLSVFLVLTLGSNILIVINDLFRRSRRARPMKEEYVERLLACYRAILMWLMPVVFTAVTFFVHLVSDLQPMREFGLFAGTMILTSCMLSLGIFMPALIIHEEFIRKMIYRNVHKKVAIVLEPAKLRLPWKKVTSVFIGCAKKAKNVLIATALISAICFIAAIATAATRGSDVGLPEVFPPSHQRSAGKPLMAAFAPTGPAESRPPAGTSVCEPGRAPPEGAASCGLHWCEAPAEEVNNTVESQTKCTCYKHVSQTDCSEKDVVASISLPSALTGSSSAAEAEIVRAVKLYISREWSGVELLTEVPSTGRRLPSLVLEHWESGLTNIESLVQAPTMRARFSNRSGTDVSSALSPSCVDRVVCYCGARVCQKPLQSDYISSSTALEINTSAVSSTRGRRLADQVHAASRQRHSSLNMPTQITDPALAGANMDDGRRLSLVTASSGASSAEVYVVYGIIPPESLEFLQGAPQWEYDPMFDPSSPWAQRAMLTMCEGPNGEGVPSNLNVLEKDCWIEEFKAWRQSQGLKFPTERFENFQDELRRFMIHDQAAAGFMWLNENGDMRATTLHMKVRTGWSADVLETQKVWLEYVETQNERAHSTADNAWPTSQAWVDAEAYSEAIVGAWAIAGLAILAVVVSGLVYTFDGTLVALVVCVSVVVCNAVAFMMFCIFQWRVGPWEIIILTVFLSYAVEPAFRMSHDFVKPNAEFGFNTNPPDDPEKEDDGVPVDNTVDPITPGKGLEPTDSTTTEVAKPPSAAEGAIVECGAPPGDGAIVPYTPPPTDDISSAGSSGPDIDQDGRDIREMNVTRSVYLVSENTLSGGVKLILSGILLLPCQFRIFSRLGAVAIVVPLIAVPCTLIILPAVLIVFMPRRPEPDCIMCSRFLFDKASWLWT